MKGTATRLAELERGHRPTVLEGGNLHTDPEHLAAVWTALEAAGAIQYPDDLPEHERAADVILQLDRLTRGAHAAHG